MIRWRIQQEAIESQETYRIDIDDPSWSGSVQEITSAGFTFQHQSLSDTEPFSQNILEGQLSFNVYIKTSDSDFMSPTNLNSIIQGEDGEYTATLKILSGGSYDTLWTGGIIPDLTTYSETFEPYQANFIAKDFILTKRQQYVPDETRQELIDIIAEIVQTEVNTNIKSLTSFDAKGSNDDYLSYVEIDDSSLVNYEDPYNNPIYKIQALQWILQSNNLILKQWDNTWYVSQFSAYDGDTGYEYNHSTGNTTSVTIRNPISTVHVSSLNKVVPAIGFLSGEYKHRTRISQLYDSVPDYLQVSGSSGTSYEGKFDADADSHTIDLSADVQVSPGSAKTSMYVEVEIAYGDYRWLTNDWSVASEPILNEWVDIADITGGAGNRRNKIQLTQQGQFGQEWAGSFAISTNTLPQGDDELCKITFYQATSNDDTHTATYRNVNFEINDDNADNNSESIKIFGSSPNNYSYVYNMQDVYFGDAVVRYQRSKYVYDNLGTYVDTSLWGYKGGTRDKEFTELLTEDIMQFQSAPKRLLNPTLKIVGTTPYNPNRSALYDSIEWVYAGGTLDGTTGNWTVKWIEAGKVDEGNTVDLTPVYDDDVREITRRTSNLTPDGKIPERDVDRSDILTQTVTSEVFQISGDQNTTAVNVILSSQENFTLTSLDIANAEDGQEILLWINPSPSSKSLTIQSTPSSAEPIIVPNGSIVRRLSSRSIFRFKRLKSDSQAYWNLIYEVSLPPTEEEEPPVIDQVATPTLSPAPGTYTGDRDLVISCATSGATIKYSTDGSEPTTTYSGAVTLTTGSYTVRAIATKVGLTDSDEAVGEYTINAGAYDAVPDKPSFDPDGGLFYTSDVDVTITTNGEPGEAQTVYYTTDGTDPDTNSSVYSTALTFTETTTLKARAKYDSGTVLSDVTVATYSKAGLSVTYSAGWNLISVPLKYPVSENSMRQIFGNTSNTIYTYQDGKDQALNTVSANLTNDLPAVKCEPGIGYWIKIPQVITVDWSQIASQRLNLLSNDSPVALRVGNTVYTWSGSNGSVAIAPFNSVVNGEDYLRLTLSSPLASYSQKIYLDEIVTRNYGATDYELSAKFSVDNAGSATVYLGIEEYDSSKSSTGTTETAVTVTATPQTITETLTSGTDYYVRPYIRIVETSPQSGGLKLYIREASFSADPGLLTSVTQDINNGWNLVGSVSSLTSITTDGTISENFYGWNPRLGTGNYVLVEDQTKLEPGKGYWAFFTTATEYTVNES